MRELPAEFPADSLRRRVSAARARLVAAGIEPSEAALDAELLLREALGWDRGRFFAHDESSLPPRLEPVFEAMLSRRERRESISLILGRREFWGLDFEVTRDVLTPRPETELVVEEALECLRMDPTRAAPGIIDVGTGSGCLAICLARELPNATIMATDTSEAALLVAARNAARHGVSSRIRLQHASLVGEPPATTDLIVSNPPYVPTPELALLPPEVGWFEPTGALDGGPDGLDVIRALLEEAAGKLSPGGWIVFEFGAGQQGMVREATELAGLAVVRIRTDLQGLPRTAVARKARHSAACEGRA